MSPSEATPPSVFQSLNSAITFASTVARLRAPAVPGDIIAFIAGQAQEHAFTHLAPRPGAIHTDPLIVLFAIFEPDDIEVTTDPSGQLRYTAFFPDATIASFTQDPEVPILVFRPAEPAEPSTLH